MKQSIVVHVPSKKYAHTVELTEDFNVFVGQMVEHTTARQTFELFGCEVACPALTGTNDNKERTFVTLVGINNAIFGEADQDTVFGEDTKEYAWFELINRVGKYGTASKASKRACYLAFKGWKDEKSLTKKNTVLSTELLNAERTARIFYLKVKNEQLFSEVKTVVKKLLFDNYQYTLEDKKK